MFYTLNYSLKTQRFSVFLQIKQFYSVDNLMFADEALTYKIRHRLVKKDDFEVITNLIFVNRFYRCVMHKNKIEKLF